jgi:hypothetical protein
MLSTLPKLAEKAFILGFFLPTLLFVLAVAALYHDHPWAMKLLAAASQKDGWDSLAYFVVAVWALSVLLMMANHAQFQILEGYRGPFSKISLFQRRERRRFETKEIPFRVLNAEWKRLGDAFPQDDKKEWLRLRRELVREFPINPDDHLPTRFGNAIRAFEVYSRHVYGADSIPLWLHLSTVVSKEFQSVLDDARAQANCAVNICFFAAIVSLIAVARTVWGLEWSALASAPDLRVAIAAFFKPANGVIVVAAIASAVVSRLAYLFSIKLIYAWAIWSRPRSIAICRPWQKSWDSSCPKPAKSEEHSGSR